MRFVLVNILLALSLKAGFVELKNGQVIDGPTQEAGNQISVKGKNYSLNDISSFESDKALVEDGGEYLVLKDGSIIKASVDKIDFKKSTLEIDFDGEEKEVSINLVKAVSFSGSRYPTHKVNGNPTLFAKTGKPVVGTLQYFTKTLVGVKTSSTIRYKKSTLGSLVFSDADIPRQPVTVFTTLREVYCGKLVEVKPNEIVIENSLGKKTIPMNRVVRFNSISGKMVDLDEKMIVKMEQTPYFDSVQKPLFNKNFTGSDVRLRGLSLNNYLSLHSKTVLTVKLPPNAKMFSAEGFIDLAAVDGDMELKIFLKGKEVFKTRVHSGDFSRKININVNGNSEMTFVADFGVNGSSGDYLILARPEFLVE